jgi:hypothetical protein
VNQEVAGATVISEDAQDGVPDHFVMADPEGNEFCVVWRRRLWERMGE